MFSKKTKTVLDLFEEELKRQHSLARTISAGYEGQKNLAVMVKTLCELASRVGDANLEKRLHNMEESIGDLYLTGRGDSPKK